MKQGFFTFGNFMGGAVNPGELKTAALWFDRVLVDNPGQDVWDDRYSIFLDRSGLDSQGKDVLSMIFQPSTPQVSRIDLARANTRQRQILHSAYLQSEREAAMLAEKNRTDSALNPRRFGDFFVRRTTDRTEVAVNKMESLLTWVRAQSFLDIPLFATPVEDGMLRQLVLPTPTVGGDAIMETFTALEIPNFSEMPWARILEFRHHTQRDVFLDKMQSFVAAISRGDRRSAIEILGDARNTDLRSMSKLSRPSALAITAVFFKEAFSGSIDIPEPMNQIVRAGEALFSLRQIWSEYERHRKFGWIHFIEDFRRE